MTINRRKLNNNGFTLAELLIVVSIIAVLTAIAIPLFGKQLEKSREAADLANARSKFAEVMTAAISENTDSEYYKGNGIYEGCVSPLKQKQDGWYTNVSNVSIGQVPSAEWDKFSPLANGKCIITVQNGEVSVDWGGESKAPEDNGIQDESQWSDYNEAGRITLGFTNKTGYYYNGNYYQISESDKKVFDDLAEEIKKQTGWNEVTITAGTNNAYMRKNEKGTWVSAVLISFAEGTFDPEDKVNVTAKDGGITMRFFFDPLDGTLLSVWTQDGSWGKGTGTSGFWGASGKQVYEYVDPVLADSEKYKVRADIKGYEE